MTKSPKLLSNDEDVREERVGARPEVQDHRTILSQGDKYRVQDLLSISLLSSYTQGAHKCTCPGSTFCKKRLSNNINGLSELEKA